MQYQVCPGVVLQTVCDEYLLIATGEARGKCPTVRQINAGAAFYWKKLCEGLDFDALLSAAATEYEIDADTLRPGLEKFLTGLEALHYIIAQ